MNMTPIQLVDQIQEAWDFIFRQGALLALMPIEQYLEAFEKAESVGAFVDPTLYRDYLQKGKGKVIWDVLKGAMVFKQAVLEAQRQVTENPGLLT